MKKIICKKEYDTETATKIKQYTNGYFGDPAGYEETLYQTPGGLYFLCIRRSGFSLSSGRHPPHGKDQGQCLAGPALSIFLGLLRQALFFIPNRRSPWKILSFTPSPTWKAIS